MMAGTGEDGPANPNGSFIYDTAVYYEEFDPIKAGIIKCRDQLEHNKWGVSVCDPLRDLDGERMRRFKNSFYQSRHAIVFLTPSVLEYMERNEDNVVEFRMCTFLSGILESHDVKTRRKVIPVMVGGPENFRKPFLLSDFSILQPGERGFNRKLYRALSKLAGPETISQRQIRQKVDRLGRDRYTEGVVTGVANGLDIPEEVLEDIKLEYGGHKAMLIEVLECWRLHCGPEATPAVADGVLEQATTPPHQVADLPPQSLVAAHIAVEPSSIVPIQRETSFFEGANPEVEAANTRDENLSHRAEQAQLVPSGQGMQTTTAQTNSEVEAANTRDANLSSGAEQLQVVNSGQGMQTTTVQTNSEEVENLSSGAEQMQVVPSGQGTQTITVNNYIRNIYITDSSMIQVGDSNIIQASQSAADEQNLVEEEEEEDHISDVEEQTPEIPSHLCTAANSSNDQTTDTPADLQQGYIQDVEEPSPEARSQLSAAANSSSDQTTGGSADLQQDGDDSYLPIAASAEEQVISEGAEKLSLETPALGETGQGATLPITTSPEEQEILEGAEKLNLNTQAAGETSQDDSVKKKGFLSGLFRSFSHRETTSDTKEKKTSFLDGLKRWRLTPQKRSDKRPVHRSTSASCSSDKKDESLMMTRSTSFHSGHSTATASRVQTNRAVQPIPTANRPDSEKLTEQAEEERLVKSLPDPPSDRVEEKNEKTKKKKAKASTPLAAT